MKITKIGGSNWLIIPSEFIKIFNLSNEDEYELSVEKSGKVIKFIKVKKEEGEDEEKKD